MKKFCIITLFLLIGFNICAEDNLTEFLIGKATSLLGQQDTGEFKRSSLGPTEFPINNPEFFIDTRDGLIIGVEIMQSFDTINAAKGFYNTFFEYFEKSDWVFCIGGKDYKIYRKNNIYVGIYPPIINSVGIILGWIGFNEDIKWLAP